MLTRSVNSKQSQTFMTWRKIILIEIVIMAMDHYSFEYFSIILHCYGLQNKSYKFTAKKTVNSFNDFHIDILWGKLTRSSCVQI